MSRIACIAVLVLAACPGLPDDSDTGVGTDPDPGTRDTADTAPPCPEDLLEENDTQASAIVPEALPVQGQVCEGDEDWFTLDAVGGCVTVVDLLFGTADGDLDLEVYQGERRIGVSSSTTDNEQARFFVEEDTAVQVRVVGFFGAENAYSLDTTSECEPCEAPDAFEDNDTPDTAASASFPLMADACIGDADWFAAPPELADGCLLSASVLALDAASSNLTLSVADATGRVVATGVQGPVTLAARVIGEDTDVIGVSAPRATPYELDAEVSCPSPAGLDCAAGLEDVWANNQPSTAVRLRDAFIVDGAVCDPSEPDWWAVPFQEGCTTVVTVTASSATGLAVATPFTNGVAGSLTVVEGTVAVSTVTADGVNQVRVAPETNTTAYRISADIVCN